MEHPRRDDTRSYEGRVVEGGYNEDYDSDEHQFDTEYLHEMARIRNWRSDQRF